MRKLKNELLANHTALKIGGPVEKILITESKNELIEIYNQQKNIQCKKYEKRLKYFSSDEKHNETIIKNTEAKLVIWNNNEK